MPTVRTSAEIQLHYEELGEGPPVICCHGLAGYAERELTWASLLAERGYRVVVFDARGHHRSTPVTDPGGYTYAVLADDVGALADVLGIERMALVGGSMGAAVTLRYALAHPERVAALVQLGPAYGAGPPTGGQGFEILAGMIESEGLMSALDLLENMAPDFPKDALDEMRSFWKVHDEASLVAALRGVVRDSPLESMDELRTLPMPVLLVGRADDPLHPLAVAKAYAKRIPRAALVEEAPDQDPLWLRPEDLASLVGGFLADAGWSAEG